MTRRQEQILLTAAALQADAARAILMGLGMFSLNQERLANGYSPGYDEGSFLSVIEQCGITEDAVETRIRNIEE